MHSLLYKEKSNKAQGSKKKLLNSPIHTFEVLGDFRVVRIHHPSHTWIETGPVPAEHAESQAMYGRH